MLVERLDLPIGHGDLDQVVLIVLMFFGVLMGGLLKWLGSTSLVA